MLTKLFVFVLMFAILFLIKEAILFARAIVSGEKNMTEKRMWGIGVALAYVLTIIFTGIGL